MAAEAAVWRRVELELNGEASYACPYRDADVTVTFTGPGGQTIERPAFWDGGTVWRVRFAPTAVGTWRWRSACSNADDTGLHGRSGEILCIPCADDHPIYRHGFLRVSDDGRRFVHSDGEPFFWLGDTHWQMPDTERVDACNHPEHGGGPCSHGGQFQHLVADRKARGFTVYQTYPSATAEHWWTQPYTEIRPDRFREVFDVQEVRFHTELTAACGNRLAALLGQLYGPLFRNTSLPDDRESGGAYRKQWAREHLAIVEALEARDEKRFLRHLRRHTHSYMRL